MKIKNYELLRKVEVKFLNLNLPSIRVGDNLKIGLKIQEGEKTRVQFYEGVVIAMKSMGLNKTVTVRRVMQGIGVERCFLIHSPKIDFIEILKSSKIRRSKLYYLRRLFGKSTRLKQIFN